MLHPFKQALMHARFKLVKAKADISNESESVKRFNKVGDDLGRIDLGAKRLVFWGEGCEFKNLGPLIFEGPLKKFFPEILLGNVGDRGGIDVLFSKIKRPKKFYKH
jgi:hypothetical protein